MNIDDVDRIITECEDTLVELYKLREEGKNVEAVIKHVEDRLHQACELMHRMHGLSDRK
jgi:hypothetical protein